MQEKSLEKGNEKRICASIFFNRMSRSGELNKMSAFLMLVVFTLTLSVANLSSSDYVPSTSVASVSKLIWRLLVAGFKFQELIVYAW